MSEQKLQINNFKNKQLNDDKISIINNKSFLQAKELIDKLLHNTLNTSLLKLESNSEEQISSLKNVSKNFNEFSKIINSLTKNVEDVKKKKLKEKEKDKKAQAFKRGRKIVTEANLNARSRTIESTLNNFKNRTINIDGKKALAKINKKQNLFGHKLGNRTTMSSFRNINEIENDKETISNQRMQKFKNISYQNTSQNFRKVKNKTIPATPVIKLREKEKSQLLAKAITSRKVNYNRNVKNNHSRTVILSHLTDIDEKSEKIENDIEFNKKIKANNKNVKRIIYKNENRNKVVRISEKRIKTEHFRNTTENFNKSNLMKTSDDINHNINNSNNINTSMNSNKNISIEKTEELKDIVKLVDDVNENLNKLLKQNIQHNKRRSSLKDIFVKNQSTNSLLTEIKDKKKIDLQNNSFHEHLLNNRKLSNLEIEGKEKNTISKSYSLNNFINKENITINIKRYGNTNTKLKKFKNIYNNIKKIKDEDLEKSLIKRNKSFVEPKKHFILFELNNKKIKTKSTKNLFEKKNTKKEIKKKMLMKKIEKLLNNNNNNKIEEKNQIVNHIIKIILDKTKEKIEIINKQKNKERDKQKKLSDKNNEDNNIEKREKYN